ncbi:MAG: nucleotide sugar dehydrogenase [Nitrospirales bacterium]|nr:nucleotide sugar dehydrogenase [Nitrospirales bacterium]
MKPVIGYAGMTHLGINSAAAAAAYGFQTVCFDPDEDLIDRLKQGKIPVIEPGLNEIIGSQASRLTFSSHHEALHACQVIYIAADVATDEQGRSDLTQIQGLITRVVPNLSSSAILVVLCQVPPGFTRNLVVSKDRLFYQVETLIFGQAVERAMSPERFIVGCEVPERELPASYKTFLDAFSCPVLPMKYESAELAKISINCCLVGMISVANTLAELCERIGADWREIVPALRLDKRIGPHAYLSPGLGIAGGNLERDLTTVCNLAEEYGTDAEVVRSWMHNSRYRKDWVLRMFHREVLPRDTCSEIAILGLAYKENTHSTKNSPSLALIAHLKDWALRVYDPVVDGSEVDHPKCTRADSPLEAVRDADVVILMTPWPEFKDVKPADLLQVMRGRTVIDPFQILPGRECESLGFQYISLGQRQYRRDQ